MQKLGLNEIRKRFLDFFESKNHYSRGSYSLVPENDASLLLINAGMAPLKNYFMGKDTPPKQRMATCQKCIRTGDIENVGKTARHGTFFEMLGNFSFGDYFKTESIHWGWEFITKVLEIPQDKLWVTVYEEDDEAFEIWEKEIKIPRERIVRLGKEDNFWEIGTGPCGPCSEIYFDRGEKFGCNEENCKPGCDCDRFLEFWNHVFTQFDKDDQGNYNKLPNPNIDTGMGLERMSCIMQDVDNIFEIDTIRYILDSVCRVANVEYGKDSKKDVSIRIMTDHIRAVTFLIADGVIPSNEGRGYVLRRLLRRAARHGKLLEIKENFLSDLCDTVIKVSGEAYPEIFEKKDYIKKVIRLEEERFQETIDQGLEILKNYVQELKANNKNIIDGEIAFKLYDTFGFPIDLTKEIAEEENLKVDEKSFKEFMQKQKERARRARQDQDDVAWKEDVLDQLDSSIKSSFDGYENLIKESKILAIINKNKIVEEIFQGEEGIIILEETPFYPEGGGQNGDKGRIFTNSFEAEVIDTKKSNNQRIQHFVKVIKGSIKNNELITAWVDETNRLNSARNHSATHILHSVLKNALGNHVQQSGSNVTSNRLRFDFTHFEAITKEELEMIEKNVNEQIFNCLDISYFETSIEDAKKMGATALFGEKYSNDVRVVQMGDFSLELCGGTHLKNTSQIGIFKILSESGIASGVRRIEAVTGPEVYNYILKKDEILNEIASVFKTKEDSLLMKISQNQQQLKEISKELSELKSNMLNSSLGSILNEINEVSGIKYVSYFAENLGMDELRELADKLKNKSEKTLVVLGSSFEGKVSFVATCDKFLNEKGIHCGNIVKEVAKIAGGGGGGKPHMAQAGAKDESKIKEALNIVEKIIELQIK